MKLHELIENVMKTEKVKQLVNYLKNYTSSPLNTAYEVLQVLDVIWTEVSSCNLKNLFSLVEYIIKIIDYNIIY